MPQRVVAAEHGVALATGRQTHEQPQDHAAVAAMNDVVGNSKRPAPTTSKPVSALGVTRAEHLQGFGAAHPVVGHRRQMDRAGASARPARSARNECDLLGGQWTTPFSPDVLQIVKSIMASL